jgi:predicted metal-dependent phosphoesterase TrpH
MQVGGENMERNMDMHLHTDASDGKHKLETLLDMLEEKDISTFSITDHDEVLNCAIMDVMAKYSINDWDFIRGVEISSAMNNYDMHILGYNFNYTENMDKLLSRIKELRREKLLRQIELISKIHGIHIEPEDIHNLMLKPGTVGKVHVINLLHDSGIEGTSPEINKKYIHGIKTGICIDADIKESISIIKEAHGIPVLAHPREIEDKHGININEIIKDLVDRGIEGIEVYNSLHTLEDIKRFLEIAKRYNLLISGGSDYHGGFIKKGVEIGDSSKEKVKIRELSLVDRIKEIGIVE